MSKDFRAIVNKRFDLKKCGGAIMSFDIQMLYETAEKITNEIRIDTVVKSTEELAALIYKELDKKVPQDKFGRYAYVAEIADRRYVIYFQKKKMKMADIDMVKIYSALKILGSKEFKTEKERTAALMAIKNYSYKGLTTELL